MTAPLIASVTSEARMERKMKVTVRLSELELAKLDVLCSGGSRDGYFRNALKPLAEQEVALCNGIH